MSDNEKDNEVKPESGNGEAEKKPDLDDTLSRLLYRKAAVDAEVGDDAEE